MQVPADPSVAGWYTRGPTPGSLGPAVIAGHVTWNLVPAVFYRLGELRPGDRVQVIRRDGQTAVFAVLKVARFAKTRFPTKQVFGGLNYAGLRLITCGGQYDVSVHRYLDNVVVFTRLVNVHPSHA
jgi:sortase (surface protein transpeptidase)